MYVKMTVNTLTVDTISWLFCKLILADIKVVSSV